MVYIIFFIFVEVFGVFELGLFNKRVNEKFYVNCVVVFVWEDWILFLFIFRNNKCELGILNFYL